MRFTRHNRKISLALFVGFSCFAISMLPVLIYSLVGKSLFTLGLDSYQHMQLQKCMLAKVHDTVASQDSSILVYNNFNDIPDTVKLHVSGSLEKDKLYRIVTRDKEGNEEDIYYLLYDVFNNLGYYAIKKGSVEDANQYIRPQIKYILCYIVFTAIIIFIVSLLFTRIVVARVKSPISAMADWSAKLSVNNINSGIPDFVYPELNAMAQLVCNSLANQFKTLQQEQLFWRYCSHELRTPVSVLRIGIDLLERISPDSHASREQQIKTVQRLKRSSYLMSQLIESLLWLGKNNGATLDADEIDLDIMINEVIYDLNKIFPQSFDRICAKLSTFQIMAPEAAARIILENAIKNAIQHTSDMTIKITQIRNIVLITNTLQSSCPDNVNLLRGESYSVGGGTASADRSMDKSGFGLGLEISRRLADRMGWVFKEFRSSKYNLVKIMFPAVTCTVDSRPSPLMITSRKDGNL